MEAAKIYAPSAKLSWFGGLLSKVHFELLQDCESYHQAIKEG
jgi:hypothetical protein